MTKLYQPSFLAKTKYLDKKTGKSFEMAFAEISNGIMVWMLIRGQCPEGNDKLLVRSYVMTASLLHRRREEDSPSSRDCRAAAPAVQLHKGDKSLADQAASPDP